MSVSPGERRRPRLALALFVFSPLVGEFLLGNQPVTALPVLLYLAPMYGGGAVLIREVARRTGGGWPMIIPLAAAYALVEEGLVDQMLFNPGYLGLLDFSGLGEVPGVHVSALLAVNSLVLHTVWSICVPIAIVEAFDDVPGRPWLGRWGLAVTATVFVVGCVGLGIMQATDLAFVATPVQFAITVVAIIALVAYATRVRAAGFPRRSEPAPRPRRVLVGAFAVSSGYWVTDLILESAVDEWVVVACCTAYVVASIVVLLRFSSRIGWGPRHVLAVSGGALLTYAWLGILHSTALPGSPTVNVTGNVVLSVGAITVLALAVRAQRRRDAVQAPA